ncbi:MAG TPA: hypothetical protein VEK73_17600, partial [Xanthobacteraceae bacterium]|nr:hypothetical protein [Xanthobacteraceae bacterium]
ERDPAVVGARDGLVCVGYRWPSEKITGPWRGTFAALPLLPAWLLGVGFVVAVVLTLYLGWGSGAGGWRTAAHVVVVAAWAAVAIVVTAIVLRIAAYFRDSYRAQNYGAPDLVAIIRIINTRIVTLDNENGRPERKGERRVQLSFIGHSMGGLVVTNAIRVLSDLFADDASVRRPLLNDGIFNQATKRLREERLRAGSEEWERPKASPDIGDVFSVKRFVLVSPDIPAEALLSNRANFLQAALLRFDEAFLFSNEGDEVLRQISTLANYFIFPTKTWKHGFRLGNVEILSEGYGVINPAPADFLRWLRVGYYTLQELYDHLKQARQDPADDYGAVQDRLPKVFTYFDCTDYVDSKTPGGPTMPLLTFALRTKQHDRTKGLSHLQHLRLLCSYGWKVDVHGGYFHGVLTQELMYRLACLGYGATLAAYGDIGMLSAACEAKQIRALISPELRHYGRPHPQGTT